MLHRRQFLGLCATAALAPSAALSEDVLKLVLWPDGPPGDGGPKGRLQTDKRGAVFNVSQPDLRVIRPKTPNGAAVLIAGGGGYRRIQERSESEPAALWFARQGVTAFVLTYRLPGEGWSVGARAPLQDAVRAMRLIRATAPTFHLDVERIGAIGFSAGGHLVGMLATDAFDPVYEPTDDLDQRPSRPAFAVLAYPVVTLMPPYDDTTTRKVLVGDNPSPALSAEWSVETHVDRNTAPIFMVQAQDDPVSNAANSVILKRACDRNGVQAALLQLGSGGHGFGMGRPGTASDNWTRSLSNWLEARSIIG